jgi:60 kDa SS-A/Ro ribonucleoprotein
VQFATNNSRADCAKPMNWAAEMNMEVDVFVIYTDQRGGGEEETPIAALQRYRETMNRPNARYMNCFNN